MANYVLDYTGRATPVTINFESGQVTNGVSGVNTTITAELITMGRLALGGSISSADTFDILGTPGTDTIIPANGGYVFQFNGQGGADQVNGFSAPQSEFHIVVKDGDLPASSYALPPPTSEGDFFPELCWRSSDAQAARTSLTSSPTSSSASKA